MRISFDSKTTMDTITCCSCGCLFAVTEQLHTELVENKDTFYCPKGHKQFFTGEPLIKRLRARLEEQIRLRSQAEMSLEALRNKARYKQCPHCSKKVIVLASHIKNKHPEK